jgi:hypothetical protein
MTLQISSVTGKNILTQIVLERSPAKGPSRPALPKKYEKSVVFQQHSCGLCSKIIWPTHQNGVY